MQKFMFVRATFYLKKWSIYDVDHRTRYMKRYKKKKKNVKYPK